MPLIVCAYAQEEFPADFGGMCSSVKNAISVQRWHRDFVLIAIPQFYQRVERLHQNYDRDFMEMRRSDFATRKLGLTFGLRRDSRIVAVRETHGMTEISNYDPFDFIQRDFVARSIVQLGRAGRLMGGDGLGVLNRSAIFQVSREPRVAAQATECGPSRR